jgi:hypothetical protein
VATGITQPPGGTDRITEQALGPAIALKLAGKLADGSTPAPPSASNPLKQVIWVDAGDEVLVHLDSVSARVLNRNLLVSADLETDQTGRSPLVVVFATGAAGDPAGLVAVTDELPRGNPILAARWGPILRSAVWAGLLGMATDFASKYKLAPRAITATQGVLVFQAGAPLTVVSGVIS